MSGELRSRDSVRIRANLRRWVAAILVWQVLVLGLCATYIALLAQAHPAGLAWAAPPTAAVIGTGIGLQFAVFALLRSSRLS